MLSERQQSQNSDTQAEDGSESIQPRVNSRLAILFFFGFMTLVLIAVWTAFHSYEFQSRVVAVPPDPAPAPVATTVKPTTPWKITTETDVDGNLSKVHAFTLNGMHIRKTGSKISIFYAPFVFDSGSFENPEDTYHAVVRYRFDDQAVVRDTWIISDSSEAIIYRGNTRDFLKKMMNAHNLEITFKPAGESAVTKSIDISQMPVDLIQMLGLGPQKGKSK